MGARLVMVAAALSLLLGACARPVAEPVAKPAAEPVAEPAAAGATAASCPTTRPPDPPFAPPAPYPDTPPPLYGDKFWYGTDRLWTWLDADGTWPMPGAPGGVQSDKSFWWREGYDWQTETTPPLQVTARRLDAAAPPVSVSAATNGFRDDIGAFMLLGLELPDEGCWELTGHYAGRTLSFVVRVR
jgi:hypothetical protein